MTVRDIPKIKIGIDVDGVIADFNRSFIAAAFARFGKPNRDYQPHDWNYQDSGLSKHQISKVWADIRHTDDFWLGVKPLPGTDILGVAQEFSDPFFVTSRISTRGLPVVYQTQLWLKRYFKLTEPQVIVVHDSREKSAIVNEYELRYFIDDKTETYASVAEHNPKCHVYRQVRPYNHPAINVKDAKNLNEYLEIIRNA